MTEEQLEVIVQECVEAWNDTNLGNEEPQHQYVIYKVAPIDGGEPRKLIYICEICDWVMDDQDKQGEKDYVLFVKINKGNRLKITFLPENHDTINGKYNQYKMDQYLSKHLSIEDKTLGLESPTGTDLNGKSTYHLLSFSPNIEPLYKRRLVIVENLTQGWKI